MVMIPDVVCISVCVCLCVCVFVWVCVCVCAREREGEMLDFLVLPVLAHLRALKYVILTSSQQTDFGSSFLSLSHSLSLSLFLSHSNSLLLLLTLSRSATFFCHSITVCL